MPRGQRTSARGNTTGSLGVFRLFGVPVRLHFTFVLLLIYLIVSRLGNPGPTSPVHDVIYLVGLFASVLAHELAHAFIGWRYGIKTIDIVMYPIGGVSRLARAAKAGEEFWVAAAGPLMNLFIGAALFGWLYFKHAHLSGLVPDLTRSVANADDLVAQIAGANVILAGFNFIPAFPMDGGRMLRAFLSKFKPEDEATRLAAWTGRMLAISMGLYGLLRPDFLLVFVAFFVYLGAAQESAAAMGRTLTSGVPVRAAMLTEYHTLAHGNTIRDAANLLLATSQQDFPIMHSEQVIGLLGRNALLRAMATDGPDAYVAGYMDREYTTLAPDMNLAEVLPLMANAGTCALVMEGERLLGLLTTENLSQFLLLRRFGW